MLPLDRKEKAEILAAETQAADEDRLAQLGYKQARSSVVPRLGLSAACDPATTCPSADAAAARACCRLHARCRPPARARVKE